MLLHVFPNFDIGGAQVRFAALARALDDRFDHAVISLGGCVDACALLPDFPGLRLETTPKGASIMGRLRAYRAAAARIDPDAILTYNWGSIEFALANVLRRTPHIHLEDGFGPEEAERRLARRSLTRRLVLRRSRVVVPSRTLQAIAERDWRLDMRRVHYIPNGIASHQGRPPPALLADLPSHLPRIVWAGALRPEKNPIRLLHAFAAVEQPAVLIIVGDGPLREPLRQEIARLGLGDRVRQLGARTDTRDLIRQCDILAVTSDTEQMPFVVLEAMDAGLPLVSTDVGDIRYMVCEENRPFLVPPTAQDLARAMSALLGREPLRRSIGWANRVRQRNIYRLDQMVENYGRLFDAVVAGSPHRAGGRG